MLVLYSIYDLVKNGVFGVKMLILDLCKIWEFLYRGNNEEKVFDCC